MGAVTPPRPRAKTLAALDIVRELLQEPGQAWSVKKLAAACKMRGVAIDRASLGLHMEAAGVVIPPPAPRVVIAPENAATVITMAGQRRDRRAARDARILRMSEQGIPTRIIAKRLGVSRSTVTRLQQRYAAAGIEALTPILKGRPPAPILYTAEDRAALEGMAQQHGLTAQRARVVLQALDGKGRRYIAEATRVPLRRVHVWIKRFQTDGLEGLRLRAPGRPKAVALDDNDQQDPQKLLRALRRATRARLCAALARRRAQPVP